VVHPADLGRDGRSASSQRAASSDQLSGTDASDYDLLLLLNDYPTGYGVEATIVDQRIIDVVFVSVDNAVSTGGSGPEGQRPDTATGGGSGIGEETPLDPSTVTEGDWPFVAWLAQARPVHDPTGVAARAQRRAEELVRHRPSLVDSRKHATRSFLSHDLRVNRTLLRRVEDPTTRAALGMRQLHTFVSAVQAWFSMRGLPNEGWKKNLTRIAEEDPDTFALIQDWLGTSDVETRHVIFEKVLHRALAPVGGALPEQTVLAESIQSWSSLSNSS